MGVAFGDEPAAHEGKGEGRVFSNDEKIALEGKGQTSTRGCAVDCCNHRCSEALRVDIRLGFSRSIGRKLLESFEALFAEDGSTASEICACAEMITGACQYDRTYVIAIIERTKRARELGEHCRLEHIATFGSVQLYRRHPSKKRRPYRLRTKI